MRPFGLLLVALLVAQPALPAARTKAQQGRSEAHIKRDIFFLASDECEGRGPNSRGLDLAADYIAKQFKQAGLKPGWRGKEWFQPFGIPGSHGTVTLTSPEGHKVSLKPGHDFVTLGHDQSGKAAGGLVFAGFGLSLSDSFDDYAGIDVTGKTVVVLRGAPPLSDVKPAVLRKAASLPGKIQLAKKQGAAAIIVVNDEKTAADDDTPVDVSFLAFEQGDKSIPALVMRRAVLQRLLPRKKALLTIERGIVKSKKPNSFALEGWKAHIETQTGPALTRLKNVIGVVEGHGPLADETVVVGAHYDHLGYGMPGKSMARSSKRAIHHGADDNASGTAAMIELARRFAAMPDRQGRRLVFIAFSGEEIWLNGSAHYVKEPAFPLKSTAAMFNLDMVGRVMKDSKTGLTKLYTEGHGTASPFKPLLDVAARKHGYTLSQQASGFGPSDHNSFCTARVPVLFVWTGDHPQYHRPDDTADRIPIAGVRKVVDFSEDLVWVMTRMYRPAFIEVKGARNEYRRGKGPKLGIHPGYNPETVGIEVKRVILGEPADRAGMKAGDRIINVAGHPVRNFTDYIAALSMQAAGSTIEVTVARGEKNVKLKVTLD